MQGATLTEDIILETLKRVIDPELGINIVDLGLIYDVRIAGRDVHVKMTLTTPGCPMHDSLTRGAQRVLHTLEGVESATVEVVWEPAWNPDMMTAEAKRLLYGAPSERGMS